MIVTIDGYGRTGGQKDDNRIFEEKASSEIG
jgi:hypothetical protein